ncbi:MAG TPA: PAS domain S-box protein [Anaerolineales bacterium]|nr:PAS domain S-box protein [Anaerolineales bacterium]
MNEIDILLQENQVPRSFLRDLVAISSLPELWFQRTPAEIAAGLAGVLLNTLYLDLVYISFNSKADNKIKVAHSKSGKLPRENVHQLAKNLESSLLNWETQGPSLIIPNPVGEGILKAVVMPIGLSASHGYLLAASKAPSFPDELNQLLLRIAVNQAAVILRQKEIEEELRNKQQELADFFENASEGMHWAGPDGTILWANQDELEMLGYTREEYIGHPFGEFYADPVIAEDIIQRLVTDQPIKEYEARLRCKDGSIKHVLINSSVYRENGKFIHTRCFTRDITERKRMEESLRRAYDETEMRVEFRTAELSAAIEALTDEIAVRKRAEAEVAELRGRLAESREAERLLLAQELHDGPIQDLFATSYKLKALTENTQISQLQSIQDQYKMKFCKLSEPCASYARIYDPLLSSLLVWRKQFTRIWNSSKSSILLIMFNLNLERMAGYQKESILLFSASTSKRSQISSGMLMLTKFLCASKSRTGMPCWRFRIMAVGSLSRETGSTLPARDTWDWSAGWNAPNRLAAS